MFISSSIWSGLEFWSVNDTLIDENSDPKDIKSYKMFGWNIS